MGFDVQLKTSMGVVPLDDSMCPVATIKDAEQAIVTIALFRFQDTPIGKAVDLIRAYGGIDGAHHKQWVIDQLMRELLGPDRYKQWIQARESEGLEWDDGIAP